MQDFNLPPRLSDDEITQIVGEQLHRWYENKPIGVFIRPMFELVDDKHSTSNCTSWPVPEPKWMLEDI